ncbi:hypothetical protein MA16_Dca003747 [Dendrobium catenatum]|uniref:Uncharacterized protein n=1 Tax=Dendrobium catenatum TaxID=906689 RepID=A0A2I0WFU1_9ASPA|nr:hypothetical protein MA16_Dca003747 [Dendrobium catenatum]
MRASSSYVGTHGASWSEWCEHGLGEDMSSGTSAVQEASAACAVRTGASEVSAARAITCAGVHGRLRAWSVANNPSAESKASGPSARIGSTSGFQVNPNLTRMENELT